MCLQIGFSLDAEVAPEAPKQAAAAADVEAPQAAPKK
jgi:hypothetical protein